MKLEVLAVAAHPDDIEITCGGLIIKLADLGKKTGILDLTAGEKGTKGSSAERLAEARAAADIMGLTVRENLNLPDAALEMTLEYKLKIASIIRKYQPDMVVLPFRDGQRHPDHRVASMLGYDACFLAGLAKADLEGTPYRPRKIIYSASFAKTAHSFFVDISSQMERKKQAIAAYRSQFDGSSQSKQIFKPGTDILELVETYNRKYGIEVGCRYAEPFWISEPILVENPLEIPVRSI